MRARLGLEQLEDRCLLRAVVAEHVFYNNSSFNANTSSRPASRTTTPSPLDSFPVNYTPNGPGDTAVLGPCPGQSLEQRH